MKCTLLQIDAKKEVVKAAKKELKDAKAELKHSKSETVKKYVIFVNDCFKKHCLLIKLGLLDTFSAYLVLSL